MLSVVRDGKKVQPTCPECGCRLNSVDVEGLPFAHHFLHDFDSTRDAQDHICTSIGKVWSLSTKKIINK